MKKPKTVNKLSPDLDDEKNEFEPEEDTHGQDGVGLDKATSTQTPDGRAPAHTPKLPACPENSKRYC
jgi:hypothetical protein